MQMNDQNFTERAFSKRNFINTQWVMNTHTNTNKTNQPTQYIHPTNIKTKVKSNHYYLCPATPTPSP